jgi:signal transduction histidine kinase
MKPARTSQSSRRWWWLVFGTCALAVIITLAWISLVVLRLEAQAQHQQWMRLALWRMDGWLGPHLRAEANRPYFVYLPFYPHERAYTRILNEIEPGEVYTPSPLLTFHSELFPLHFQLSADGQITSPQVPGGNWRDLAESQYALADAIARKQPLLAKVTALLGPTNIDACVSATEATLAKLVEAETLAWQNAAEAQVPNAAPSQQTRSQQWSSKADLQQRMNTNYQQQEAEVQTATVTGVVPAQAVDVGLLVPLWISTQPANAEGSAELVFVRRVTIGSSVFYQGMLVDWPRMRAGLLEQIHDLFPTAALTRVLNPEEADAESGRMLGSVPVLLESPAPGLASGPWLTISRAALGMTWMAVLAALAAAAITLRASIHYGEKRSRFASAVTHELRTPLTTFRMYSEMLAEGMVRDEAQRAVYLNTLKNESSRLATLVENVLSYARLEEGRSQPIAKSVTVKGLLDEIAPVLQRRAAAAGMTLHMDNRAGDAPLVVDTDAVCQILFNIVENSCKYACPNGDARPESNAIDITCEIDDGRLHVRMRDYGPGIEPHFARAIFKPFERGRHNPGDTIPGVGLGLALARGLAQHLGGDLTLVAANHQSHVTQPGQNDQRGAAFLLVIPLRQR